MQATVGSKIRVVHPTVGFVRWCEEELVIDNPDYYKLVRLNKWTGNTPKQLKLYERGADYITVPFGCFRKVFDEFKNDITFSPDFSPFKRVQYKSLISLYPYQRNAVEASIQAKNGIIVMPCGSGKTQTALELIARLGGRTLWLTHTQDLLNQSMNRAKSVYGIDHHTFGTITGGKVDIGSSITFATVQTMAKIDLTSYRYDWDIIVVDECHKAVGRPTKVMQFYKVLSNLSCRYKYGLTATPDRSDGLGKSMFSLLGDIIYEVDKQEVADTTCPVEVQFINTGYFPDISAVLLGDGTLNYTSLVNDLTSNEERFNLVKDTIEQACKSGATLVLGNRVEYLQRLNDAIEVDSICLSSLGVSKAAKSARKNALEDLNSGKIGCVLATYQLAKEGLDVPNLRTLVLATPEKDQTTITQSAGRVARKAPAKISGTIIDFADDFGMLKGWKKKRQNIYKKLGYTLKD